MGGGEYGRKAVTIEESIEMFQNTMLFYIGMSEEW